MFKTYKNPSKYKSAQTAESKLQAQCVVDMQNFYPLEAKGFIAITNNSENAIKGALNKAMGVKEGASDTFYMKQGEVVFIEFKKPTGGRQSDKQKAFEAHCILLGHKYVLCNDYFHFWDIVELPCPRPNFSFDNGN